MTIEIPDELLVSAEAMAAVLTPGREPTAKEVRRMRHWIKLGLVRTRKMGQLLVTTRRHLLEDVMPPEAVEAA